MYLVLFFGSQSIGRLSTVMLLCFCVHHLTDAPKTQANVIESTSFVDKLINICFNFVRHIFQRLSNSKISLYVNFFILQTQCN